MLCNIVHHCPLLNTIVHFYLGIPLTPSIPSCKIEGIMAKTIKLDNQVHQDLEELRGKRETFSQVVARLVNFHREIARAVWGYTGEHPRTPGQGV